MSEPKKLTIEITPGSEGRELECLTVLCKVMNHYYPDDLEFEEHDPREIARVADYFRARYGTPEGQP